MQHLSVKAASTVTDEGRFSAIAAAWSVDRVGDQIVRGAFDTTIKRWQKSGKRLPVHWNHSGSASDVIGWIFLAANGHLWDEEIAALAEKANEAKLADRHRRGEDLRRLPAQRGRRLL